LLWANKVLIVLLIEFSFPNNESHRRDRMISGLEEFMFQDTLASKTNEDDQQDAPNNFGF
jgi:hypothetical protein